MFLHSQNICTCHEAEYKVTLIIRANLISPWVKLGLMLSVPFIFGYIFSFGTSGPPPREYNLDLTRENCLYKAWHYTDTLKYNFKSHLTCTLAFCKKLGSCRVCRTWTQLEWIRFDRLRWLTWLLLMLRLWFGKKKCRVAPAFQESN